MTLTRRDIENVIEKMQYFKACLNTGIANDGESKLDESTIGFEEVAYMTSLIKDNGDCERTLYMSLSQALDGDEQSWPDIRAKFEAAIVSYLELITMADIRILSTKANLNAGPNAMSDRVLIIFDLLKRELLNAMQLTYEDPVGRVVLKSYLQKMRYKTLISLSYKWDASLNYKYAWSQLTDCKDDISALAQCVLVFDSDNNNVGEHMLALFRHYQKKHGSGHSAIAESATQECSNEGCASAAAASAVSSDPVPPPAPQENDDSTASDAARSATPDTIVVRLLDDNVEEIRPENINAAARYLATAPLRLFTTPVQVPSRLSLSASVASAPARPSSPVASS